MSASGSRSLVQGLKFLEALHNQLLNVSKPESQQIEAYGVMCPRWAASEELTDAEAKTLMVDVIRRRAIQSAPIFYAIKVLRELVREHELSESIPASELDNPTDCFTCFSKGTVPGLGQPCIKCKTVRTPDK